jgi:hypothetical protein
MNDYIKRLAGSYPLSPRPSKTRLHRMLKKDLKNRDKKDTAADIAAQDFMNYKLFCQRVYLGVDISRKELVDGIESVSESECKTELIDAPVTKNDLSLFETAEDKYAVGVRGDIYDYNLFPKDSIDLVVSTNTLIENQLSPTSYRDIINSFCEYISKDGELIFNIAQKNIGNEIMRDLDRRFDHVEVIRYSNTLSNIWESYLENNKGEIKMSNGLFFYIQYFVSFILYMIESLYSGNATRVYVKCKNN